MRLVRCCIPLRLVAPFLRSTAAQPLRASNMRPLHCAAPIVGALGRGSQARRCQVVQHAPNATASGGDAALVAPYGAGPRRGSRRGVVLCSPPAARRPPGARSLARWARGLAQTRCGRAAKMHTQQARAAWAWAALACFGAAAPPGSSCSPPGPRWPLSRSSPAGPAPPGRLCVPSRGLGRRGAPLWGGRGCPPVSAFAVSGLSPARFSSRPPQSFIAAAGASAATWCRPWGWRITEAPPSQDQDECGAVLTGRVFCDVWRPRG